MSRIELSERLYSLRSDIKDGINTFCIFERKESGLILVKIQFVRRVQSRAEFIREVSLLNEGEFKGFFDREMHALLLLSLRSLPPEFKMSLSASLSATF
ncbi:hypothetical protein Syun_031959 [Stephania yunnanensis]|uniref:Uncharacterized protein n=1 Tax=Stephania yunnanensis TaxID=152371 RepID=A0AAP0E406_9MAGN